MNGPVFTRSFLLISSLLFFIVDTIPAENIVYPGNAGVVNAARRYNADKNGVRDATDELTNACRSEGFNIIYLPAGTYLVSDKVWFRGEGSGTGPILQGQGEHKTVIKLKPNCPGFQDPGNPKPVLQTGRGHPTNFSRGVRNLTVFVGKGNPGAIGIEFMSNNNGLLDQVSIISEDGQGKYGLDLKIGDNGPLTVRNLTVKGFDIGVNGISSNTATLTNINVENQNETGMYVANHHSLYVENYYSKNSVIALHNEYMMVLINSTLTGGSPDTMGIYNHYFGHLFARNLKTSGYKGAILNRSRHSGTSIQESDVDEFVNYGTTRLFNAAPEKSLNLPVKQPPLLEWDQDVGNWSSVTAHGARTGKADNSQPFQNAIDAGKKTVYIPATDKKFQLRKPVIIRGAVERIVGCPAKIMAPDGDNGSFVIRAGSSPVVYIEDISAVGTSAKNRFRIIQESNRTVVIKSVQCFELRGNGSGDVFAVDLQGRVTCMNPKQSMWIRGYNSEKQKELAKGEVLPEDAFNLQNTDGNLWVLGYKSEGIGIKVKALGGKTEVLGFFMYSPYLSEGDTYPLVEVDNAHFTMAAFSHVCHGTDCATRRYSRYVREKQQSISRVLFADSLYTRKTVPLYNALNGRSMSAQKMSLPERGNSRALKIGLSAGNSVRVEAILPEAGHYSIGIYNSQGRLMGRAEGWSSPNGTIDRTVEFGRVGKSVHVIEIRTGSNVVVSEKKILR